MKEQEHNGYLYTVTEERELAALKWKRSEPGLINPWIETTFNGDVYKISTLKGYENQTIYNVCCNDEVFDSFSTQRDAKFWIAWQLGK